MFKLTDDLLQLARRLVVSVERLAERTTTAPSPTKGRHKSQRCYLDPYQYVSVEEAARRIPMDAKRARDLLYARRLVEPIGGTPMVYLANLPALSEGEVLLTRPKRGKPAITEKRAAQSDQPAAVNGWVATIPS